MYVLARRVGDSVIIHGVIEVKLLSVNGQIARIGIDAPREISVERKEVVDSVEKSDK